MDDSYIYVYSYKQETLLKFSKESYVSLLYFAGRDVCQFMFVSKISLSNSGQKGCVTVSTDKTVVILIIACFLSL